MGLSVGLGNVTQVPAGIVSAFAGVTAPSGWLMCYGQAVSRTEYSALFTALSTTYGSGDGSTTFNIPDMRGRAVAGVDNMGGTAASRLTSTVLTASNTLGATGGTQTHTLDISQIPSVASATHRHDFKFALNDNYYQPSGTAGAMTGSGAYRYSTGAYQSSSADGSVTDTRQDAGAETISSGSSGRYATIGDTQTPSATAGGGTAHLNTQPTIVLNYIIKATQ
jgi:microcystin-dependent protein